MPFCIVCCCFFPKSFSFLDPEEQEVVDNAFLFLAAGFETTSNALAYVAYLLALHPDVQEQVFEEVSQVVKAEVRARLLWTPESHGK